MHDQSRAVAAFFHFPPPITGERVSQPDAFLAKIDNKLENRARPLYVRRMQLGFVSAILPEVSLEDVLAFAAETHYSTIEVMCWPVGKAERRFAGVTHLDVEKFSRAQAEDTLALTQKHGVSISALGYYPNPLEPDEAAAKRAVAHLKKVIQAAAMLGLSTVNTFIGRDWTKSVDDNWPRVLKTWKPLIKFAEDHDIRIGIENCPMMFGRNEWPGGKNIATTPVIWRRLFNDLASENLGLNYDPSHFAFQMMDPVSPLREFAARIFHMHAKDVEIPQEQLNDVGIFGMPSQWHRPRIPGYGVINWARFMAGVTAIGYTGPVCIEVEDDTFGKDIEGRKRAIKVARNVLAPFFP
jgi:sugar phosphate isomerase/epimerase